MDRIRNEAIRTKMGMKKDVLQETEEQQLRWSGHVMRIGLQNCWTGCRMEPAGGGEARQTSEHMKGWE
jgi:hypothetical protein